MFFNGLVLLGVAIFAILCSMIMVDNVFGGINYMVVFGQTDSAIKLGNESKPDLNNGDKKLAIITFDDGKNGQILYAKQILDTYGYSATFSIISNNVSKSDHLNWHDTQRLEKDGYDLASHSMNHTELEDIPMDVAIHELVSQKNAYWTTVSGALKCLRIRKTGGQMTLLY